MPDSPRLSQEQEAFLSRLFELIAEYKASGVSGYNQIARDSYGHSVYMVTVWVEMGNAKANSTPLPNHDQSA